MCKKERVWKTGEVKVVVTNNYSKLNNINHTKSTTIMTESEEEVKQVINLAEATLKPSIV